MAVPSLALESFDFSRYIIDLTEEEFEEAKSAVQAMWYGVFELWSPLPQEVRNAKRALVFKYLIMWYLADLFPTRLSGGIMGSGGLLLNGKTIKSVQLHFRKLNLPECYEPLGTNQFGLKASIMIRTAPEMGGIYGT